MNYGLIGEKLGHSYSKEIHEMLADYTYELCPLSKDEFAPFMENHEFRAINVTIPYKKDVIPYMTEIDENARLIGAINTIVNRDGKLYGYNTDYLGFKYMVEHHDIDMTSKKVIVLGNGGAAMAIKAVVRSYDISDMIVVKRTSDGEAITYEECFDRHADAQIIINTSPVGMYPDILTSPVDLNHFPKCRAVLDIIYNPSETKLTAQAKTLGMVAVTGLEMLIAQAKYAVEIFLDKHIDDSEIDTIYKKIIAK